MCGWAHIIYIKSKKKAIVRIAQIENQRLKLRLIKTIFCQKYLVTGCAFMEDFLGRSQSIWQMWVNSFTTLRLVGNI